MESDPTHDDRRAYIRKPCAFDVVWAPETGPEMRGHGFEVSTEGLVFALPAKMVPATLRVTAIVRNKAIELAVHVLRKDAMLMQEVYWTKLACKITQTDTQAWAEAIESTPGRSLPQQIPPAVEAVLNKRHGKKPAATPLPVDLKERIAKLMLKRERMDPWRKGEAPAISFSHVGEEKDPLGRPAQHYKIDTTRQRQGKAESLSTIIALVEGGEIMIVKE